MRLFFRIASSQNESSQSYSGAEIAFQIYFTRLNAKCPELKHEHEMGRPSSVFPFVVGVFRHKNRSH